MKRVHCWRVIIGSFLIPMIRGLVIDVGGILLWIVCVVGVVIGKNFNVLL